MTTVVIEDWIAQHPNLLKQCETILGRSIPYRTWHHWQELVGVCYSQGKRLETRKYTEEQAQLLLCLAWFRRLFPRKKLTYRMLRGYWKSNEYKIEEALQAIANGEHPSSSKQEKLVKISEVKQWCDAILGRSLSRKCWVAWKRHLAIPMRSKEVDEGTAALLVFMASWRHDHPTAKFPSVNRLIAMMRDRNRSQMTLDTFSSAKMFHKWEMQGCKGKDLPKYLAACGYKVSPFTLYKWGDYSQRKHYTVSELAVWRRMAKDRRNTQVA